MAYVLRRAAQTLFVVLGVSALAFALMFLSGDPTELMLGPGADFMTQEQIEAFRKAKGFDRPWLVQYIDFLGGAVRGDFGESYRHRRPAFELIAERMPHTVELASFALALSVVVAIPMGVVAATRRNTIIDTSVMMLALAGQSVPGFWLGIMLMLLFGVELGWLPISGRGTFAHIILPGFTLAVFSLARNARLTRSALLEVIAQDYVRTARAKGLSERVVVYKHALRNALIPIVTMVGLQLGFLLGGSVIIETIFAWPGVGRLIVESIGTKDFTVVQAGVTVLAVVFVLANLLVDLSYVLLDPKIRYD